MLLCCPVCGNSFYSSEENTKCDYCYNDAKVLISDNELESIPKEEVKLIAEALKEKYKSEDNDKYNPDFWSAREAKEGVLRAEEEKRHAEEEINKFYYNLNNHKTTTSQNFEGYRIKKYISVISGNVVLGTGMFSEWSASVTDFLGTTSTPYENKMEKAKSIAVKKLIRKSAMLGGNAVVAIDFDFFTVGNNMMAVSANGTSVFIEEDK